MISKRSPAQARKWIAFLSLKANCFPCLLWAVQLLPAMWERANVRKHSLLCLTHHAFLFIALLSHMTGERISRAIPGLFTRSWITGWSSSRKKLAMSPNTQVFWPASPILSQNDISSAWQSLSHSIKLRNLGWGTLVHNWAHSPQCNSDHLSYSSSSIVWFVPKFTQV